MEGVQEERWKECKRKVGRGARGKSEGVQEENWRECKGGRRRRECKGNDRGSTKEEKGGV